MTDKEKITERRITYQELGEFLPRHLVKPSSEVAEHSGLSTIRYNKYSEFSILVWDHSLYPLLCFDEILLSCMFDDGSLFTNIFHCTESTTITDKDLVPLVFFKLICRLAYLMLYLIVLRHP